MSTPEVILPRRLTRIASDALLERWRSSGMDVVAFCRQAGLPEKRMRRLIERRMRVVRSGDGPGFSAVVASNPIRVRTPSGLTVEVDPGFDAALLRQVLEAVC